MLDTDSAIDLGSLIEHASTVFASNRDIVGAAEQVRSALKGVVVQSDLHGGQPWLFHTNTWSWKNSAGLSIYLPLGADEWRRRYYRSLAFGAGNRWADLIDSLWGQNLPNDPACAAPCRLPQGQMFRRQIFIPVLRR